MKKDVTSVGFQLVHESDVLKNPADDLTRPVRDVPRGKTDQFFLLFQKP